MNIQRHFGCLAIGCFALLNIANAQDSSFRFLATGDLPYSQKQAVKYRKLLKQAEREKFAFLMHVGDTKSQSTPCSDDEFEKIRDLFRQHPTPVVYSLGDNEWTDCHSVGADPIERLDKLRELFFEDKTVLRLNQLKAMHQNHNPKFARYVENYRFTKAGVLFIMVHVCGSGNNRRVNDAAAMKEFAERNAANLVFLKESFEAAVTKDIAGVALVIHANPDFEGGKQKGFHDFLGALRNSLSTYRKPVVCIHGDSHYYRIDKPLRDLSGHVYLHFTRMEVFGSPNVAGVIVTVDRTDPEVFSYRPYYLDEE